MRRLIATWLVWAASATGCGDPPPTAAPRTEAVPAQAPLASSSSITTPSGPPSNPDGADTARAASDLPFPPLAYDPTGRRDPFAPDAASTADASAPRVAPLKLTGVIQGPAPLALLEAPDGTGYIVKPGDTLGDGRVLDVVADAVTIRLAARGQRTPETMTLTLAGD